MQRFGHLAVFVAAVSSAYAQPNSYHEVEDWAKPPAWHSQWATVFCVATLRWMGYYCHRVGIAVVE